MKKVLLFAIVLGGAVAFTSCGSDECECTVGGQTSSFTEDDASDAGVDDFKAFCEGFDALYKIGGSTTDGCEMK